MGYMDRKVIKAKLGELVFHFNPSTMSNSGGSEFTQSRGVGMDYPLFTYTGGREQTISFEIYLNDLAIKPGMLPTAKFCEKIEQYRYTGGTTSANTYKPLYFVFGDKVYKCLVSQADIEYLAFDSGLTPIEAKVHVTLTIL